MPLPSDLPRLRLTHTGLHPESLFLSDIDARDDRDYRQFRLQVYIPFAAVIELPLTDDVQNSYNIGVIRGFIERGFLTGVIDLVGGAGGGDMFKAVYDPTGVNGDAFDADLHAYDPTTSGMVATDTQAAIDEIDFRVDALEVDSHPALTLNAGGTTQDSSNLVGQELELVLATTTTDGVLSAADKTKLDGITTGAQPDQNIFETVTDGVNSAVADTTTDTLTMTGTEGVDVTVTPGTDTVTTTLDVDGLAADATPDGAADYVATYDASAGVHKKVLLDDLPGGGGGSPDQNLFESFTDGVNTAVADTVTDTMTVTGTEGVDVTVTPGTDTITTKLDVSGLTVETVLDNAADLFVIYDDSASAHRKVTIDSLLANLPGVGRSVQAGRTGNTATGSFFEGPGKVTLNATDRGIPVEKGTILWVGVSRSDATASTLEVLVNGSVVATLATAAAGLVSATYAVDHVLGLMSFRNISTGTSMSNVSISVITRRRP